MSAESATAAVSMDAIVALAKRRGFIFQSSEIYGGLNGFFDYGPLGVELKKNIRDCWWADMVRRRDDVVGVETSIIMHPKVWEASGHVAGFTDPLVDCKVSKQRFRADQLFFAAVVVDGQTVGYVSALESEKTTEDLQAAAENFKRKKAIQGKLEPVAPRDFTEAKPEEVALIPSPATGNPGDLTEARAFNMMFQTNVGAMTDASSVAYLRPETAQGMFVDFKNVVDTGRVKLPFGIAQIGKSFRNEITPRNFIFRSREFEQMEMEYFIHPDADWLACHEEWLKWCRDWLLSIGLPESHLSLYEHKKEKLAFYSRRTVDIMFQYPFGVQELWGIAARSDYDLKQHQQFSGVPQIYFDEATKQKVVPHVIEPAVGVDRILLAVLCAGYAEEDGEGRQGQRGEAHRAAPLAAHRPGQGRRAPAAQEQGGPRRPRPRAPREVEAQLRRVLRRGRRDRPPLPPPGRNRHAVVRDHRLRHHREGRHLHPARARLDAADAHHRGAAVPSPRREGVLTGRPSPRQNHPGKTREAPPPLDPAARRALPSRHAHAHR
jgi:glycyl-tRNA synthetase